jgi:hypothetical protein
MRKQRRFAEALWAQGIAHRRAAYADLGISKSSRPLPRPTRNQIRIDHVHITEAYALHCSGIEISTADISRPSPACGRDQRQRARHRLARLRHQTQRDRVTLPPNLEQATTFPFEKSLKRYEKRQLPPSNKTHHVLGGIACVIQAFVATGNRRKTVHDVAPAADGSIWFTGQRSGVLGRLSRATARSRRSRSAGAPLLTASQSDPTARHG